MVGARFLIALPAPRAGDPHVDFAHRADGARLDQLDHAAVIVARMNLRPHLRGDLGLACRFEDDTGLPDIMRERFLAIDVLAQLQGWQHGEGVRVLARADHYGVKVLLLVEQTPEIAVLFRAGILLHRPQNWPFVHVAQGNDVL